MSNKRDFETMSLDERARLRKQMSDQAVNLAINSRWDEAASVNREYLKTFGDETEALNRLGKALSETGQITQARAKYARAIEIDPTNIIARRNLDRLASMTDTSAADAAPSQLDTRLFVEETGASTVAKLQATDADRAAQLDAGDVVELQAQGNAVNVLTVSGEYVGMLEPKIGLRLSKMMAAGNQYAAAMVTVTPGALKVMLRETFKHPTMISKVSFPKAKATEVRAYTRKNLLRREGDDVEFGDDDVEDEPEEGWTESSDEDATTPEVDADSDEDGFN
ncbi:MAG: tetratricopeptide repeat protein [Anaerolineaceae bacterium]